MNKKERRIIGKINNARLRYFLILNPNESETLCQYITSLEEKVETKHKAYMGTVKELTETATEKEKLNNIVNELEKSLTNEIKRLESVEQTPVIVLLTGKVCDIYDELKKLEEGK